jgi:hypothetical protein
VRARLVGSIGVPVVAWAGAVLTLAATRPDPLGEPAAWTGDDVARLACWALLAAYAAWMTVALLAWSVVAARHGVVAARSLTRCAPPVARRALRVGLAGTLTVAPTTVPPVTLHVGPDGRLPGTREPAPTRPTTPPTTAVGAAPSPVPHPPRTTRAEHPRVHRVVAGDNLWTIARAELARRNGRAPADHDIVPYWSRVIAANRATLRSGDPNLIYPGEIVALPNP